MTGLETILQQHQEGTWNEDADDNLTFGCDCGQRSEPFPNTSARISTDNVDNAGEWHRAHVADQIRGWLLSDPVIKEAAESIADAHWCESNYTSGCNCRDYREREARAAITAALDTTGDS